MHGAWPSRGSLFSNFPLKSISLANLKGLAHLHLHLDLYMVAAAGLQAAGWKGSPCGDGNSTGHSYLEVFALMKAALSHGSARAHLPARGDQRNHDEKRGGSEEEEFGYSITIWPESEFWIESY